MSEKAAKCIDYSKWDKIDYSDDDDDSTDSIQGPTVTRLDEPSTITYNPDGSLNIHKKTNRTDSKKSVKSITSNSSKSEVPVGKDSMDSEKLCQLTKNGGEFISPKTNTESFWCQDRYEATLSIVYDHSIITSKDIRVDINGVLNFSDRFSAVGGGREVNDETKGTIIVRSVSHEIPIFQGQLAYPIYLAEDEDQVDWEIDSLSPQKKLIKITLLKAVPMQGLSVWWSRPVIDYPQIDVIKDVKERNNGTDGKDKSEQMKEVWEKAHRMFREKVQQRQTKSIDISSSQDIA
mmetsp:Transcript_31296/g.36521  ORF Transcript_31296/g.36521 Transcript_31296/m.36521 type:complete len:291 (+) Transcript_31296:72-944(+)